MGIDKPLAEQHFNGSVGSIVDAKVVLVHYLDDYHYEAIRTTEQSHILQD